MPRSRLLTQNELEGIFLEIIFSFIMLCLGIFNLTCILYYICLHISNFEFLWLVCVYISCALSFLFVCLVIFSIGLSVFVRDIKNKVWIWKGGSWGRIWEGVRDGEL